MRAESDQPWPLLQTIRDDFAALSPQLQRGARFLIDHPEEVALFSMRDIARRAGVQPVTLVRLARERLGFGSWLELRHEFVERIRGAPEPFSRRAADLIGREAGLFHETFGAVQNSLEATRAAITAERVNSVAEALENAGNIYIAGFRSCFAPAFSFYYAYRLFRPRGVFLLSGVGGGFEAELRGLGKKDAVVIIGFDPYSREAALVADAAAQAEAALIAVTDSAVSPLALKAAHTLLFSTRTPSFFPSVAAASALLESLVAVLVARAGKAAVADLRAAEAQLFATGAYLPPRKGRRP